MNIILNQQTAQDAAQSIINYIAFHHHSGVFAKQLIANFLVNFSLLDLSDMLEECQAAILQLIPEGTVHVDDHLGVEERYVSVTFERLFETLSAASRGLAVLLSNVEGCYNTEFPHPRVNFRPELWTEETLGPHKAFRYYEGRNTLYMPWFAVLLTYFVAMSLGGPPFFNGIPVTPNHYLQA